MADAAFGNLTGLKTVVTGSSTGIGRAIALEFARAGADVVVHCRHAHEKANAVADEIGRLGRRAEVVSADIGLVDELDAFIEQTWNCFQGIDVWVNNAGVDLLTGEESDWDYRAKLEQLLTVDVRGTVLLSRSVGARMADADGGAILTIGWDQADRGMAGESGELFSTAKNAIMGFTRSMALSLAPRVRVNCIAPGWIRTAWGENASDHWQQRVRSETPLQRWGTPADVAKMARFLASPDADYITGQVFNVNGGAVR